MTDKFRYVRIKEIGERERGGERARKRRDIEEKQREGTEVNQRVEGDR